MPSGKFRFAAQGMQDAFRCDYQDQMHTQEHHPVAGNTGREVVTTCDLSSIDGAERPAGASH
ncbi:MAG TPA: hypothetical protein PKJ96_11625 [Thiobacillaceae bacterium]|nr:hypothetical protein [Thiobacillaceae bacterium]